ncbi:MAG: hypothetical protein MO846_03295 [Candidatus Devosia symbiotica]|nr:hypothetical protein [Candidatus Devosia symbiotica]
MAVAALFAVFKEVARHFARILLADRFAQTRLVIGVYQRQPHFGVTIDLFEQVEAAHFPPDRRVVYRANNQIAVPNALIGAFQR